MDDSKKIALGRLLTEVADAKFIIEYLEEQKEVLTNKICSGGLTPEIVVSKDGIYTTVVNNMEFAEMRVLKQMISTLNAFKNQYKEETKNEE